MSKPNVALGAALVAATVGGTVLVTDSTKKEYNPIKLDEAPIDKYELGGTDERARIVAKARARASAMRGLGHVEEASVLSSFADDLEEAAGK